MRGGLAVKRSPGLGPFQLFTVLFGTIIGVAWIVATGLWINEAGPAGALLAFGVGALIMWLIGLCFAEMMAMFPDANGSMAYVFEAFGERAAAAAGWFLVLMYAATCGWYFVTIAWLLETVLPALGGPVVYEAFAGQVRLGDVLLGLGGVVAITIVNLRGVGPRAVFQDALVVMKIVIGITLFGCALLLGRSEYLNPLFAVQETAPAWIGVLSVAVMTPFFFAGFDVLPQAVRDRRPGVRLQSLGAIVGLATAGAFVFYGGAILAAAVSMERSALQASTLPIFSAFKEGLGQPWLAYLAILAGISGILTGWNANLMSGARVLQGMARAGVTLPFFALERPPRAGEPPVPLRATLFISALAVAMGLLGRNALGPIVDMAAVPLLVVFALVCTGLIKLRRLRPNDARPYRVSEGTLLPWLAVVLSIGLIAAGIVTALAGGGLLQWILMLLWAFAGALFWHLAASHRNSLDVEERKLRVLQGE
jgi:amino acid transporter